MRALSFLSLAMLLILAGCGGPKVVSTGPNGEKVTSDASGNVTIDDGKGTKIDYNTDKNGNMTMKSNNGAEYKVENGAITGKNEKGETYSMGASTVSEGELGVPFYPGSSETTGKDMKIDADGKQTYMSNRTTSDSPDKVGEFYKGKVKDATLTSGGGMTSVGGKLENGADFTMISRVEDGKTQIQISTSKKK